MIRMLYTLILSAAFFSMQACTPLQEKQSVNHDGTALPVVQKNLEGLSKAYFASGCFWCVEAIFESVTGVEEVISGYSGSSPRAFAVAVSSQTPGDYTLQIADHAALGFVTVYAGQKVTVRYNLQDLSCVHVYAADQFIG